jgi:diaminopimelate decarboxylase
MIMNNIFTEITDKMDFYMGNNAMQLIKEYGSPLYVYSEKIIKEKCRAMKSLIEYDKFSVNYSAKANSNLHLLKIIKDEGLNVDAMSPGEIFVQLEAGFKPEQIFYICNNVSKEEMLYAIDKNIMVSVDSLSQLELFGSINKGGKVAIRFNPGIGAGHSEKVVTGGKNTKFGISGNLVEEVKKIVEKYNLKVVGINQHIGSLFMETTPYIEGVKAILGIAEKFEDLEFIDIGGGFGTPYRKQNKETNLDLESLGIKLDEILKQWVDDYDKQVTFKVEPGRYVVAESGVLLGTVHAIKENYGIKYIGTDLGFNVLSRPVIYDSHHDIEVMRENSTPSKKMEKVNIVGNICESGDIIAKDRMLPEIFEGDIIGVLDSGAYGYVMGSNYNNRLRPAEILIKEDTSIKLIRKRDELEGLLKGF